MLSPLHRVALGYLRGLLSRVARANCVRIAERAGMGHDGLTRMLSKTTIDAEAYIRTYLVSMFVRLNVGSIIIDDTALNKEFARKIEGCSWVWSSAKEKTIFGYNVVALCWSDGTRTIPLIWRWYEKETKETKIDLAVDMLEYAKKRLNIEPEYVLFDSFYAADKILKRCEEYGWKYLGRVKKNRLLNGTQIRHLHATPGGARRESSPANLMRVSSVNANDTSSPTSRTLNAKRLSPSTMIDGRSKRCSVYSIARSVWMNVSHDPIVLRRTT